MQGHGRTPLETFFHVRLFGPIVIKFGDRRLGARDLYAVKPKQLFEILLIAGGRILSKDKLADVLWSHDLPRDYRATVETYVSILRRRLEPQSHPRQSIISTEPGGYRLVSERVVLDLDRFDALVAEATNAEDARAACCLGQAIDLVNGEILEDEPYAEWACELRDSYRPRIVQALVDASALALSRGDARSAFTFATRAITTDPAVETAYRLGMTAAHRLGRREEALRLYLRCEQVLQAELGMKVSAETHALASAVRLDEEPLLVL
jgi:DNA-binding SARP family transcriptional activator